MKFKYQFFILFFGICSLFAGGALQKSDASGEALLNNIDAKRAIAIANHWKWTNKKVKSYVTPGEVVFKFSDKNIKRIQLPADAMVVAVAPYIRRTHK